VKSESCAGQNKIKVWLDCDPGLDDTFAIILAAKSEQIELLGVSTSAGNTNLNSSTKNAGDILHNIGRDDVVVVRGSEQLVYGAEHLA
jgi:inosine-uridine nucleoside N-ribohydrolase